MFAPFDEIEEELGPVALAPPPTPAGAVAVGSVIRDAVATLEDDDCAALMGMATSDGTVKAAFVVKTDNGWNAVAWFERKDGHNAGGVGVMKTWKRGSR
jgi:hypothetical protein